MREFLYEPYGDNGAAVLLYFHQKPTEKSPDFDMTGVDVPIKENQKRGLGEFWCDKCKQSYRTEIYPVHNSRNDITFIMEDVYKGNDEYLVSTEIKGFYYGNPDEENNRKYYGKLKANF